VAEFHIICYKDGGTLKPLELMTAGIEVDSVDVLVQHVHMILVLTVDSPFCEFLLDYVP